MVMLGGRIYEVSGPLHPKLLCTIDNTSAHLLTGDTFVYLKPVSPTETDIILHSIGSGNESNAGSFPFNAAYGSWLPEGGLMAYTVDLPPDSVNFGGSVQVWLYSQGHNALLRVTSRAKGQRRWRSSVYPTGPWCLPPTRASFGPCGIGRGTGCS